MRTVYHFSLCPFSRKLRIQLAEKGLDFELVSENYWENRREFLMLNPAMQVPVLVEPDGKTIPDSYAISEYIEAQYCGKNCLLGDSTGEGAGIRRLISWYDNKFYNEVTKYLVNEKVIRYLMKVGEPNSDIIRKAKKNLRNHLKYLSFLTSDCKYLMGEKFSMADIAAAAQISVIDYLGEMPWDDYPNVKDWYALIKSRPSFRGIMKDNVSGFKAPVHYANPDF